jgi:hypothetical protein
MTTANNIEIPIFEPPWFAADSRNGRAVLDKPQFRWVNSFFDRFQGGFQLPKIVDHSKKRDYLQVPDAQKDFKPPNSLGIFLGKILMKICQQNDV